MDYYEITVMKDGRHLFSTAPSSAPTRSKAERVYEEISEKFPESQGYKVTVMFWEMKGREV